MKVLGMPGPNSGTSGLTHRPTVTAGFRCAPEAAAMKTPEKTARPHPQLIIRNPPPNPLDLANTTLATTPPPIKSNSIVPSISAMNAFRDMVQPLSCVSEKHGVNFLQQLPAGARPKGGPSS